MRQTADAWGFSPSEFYSTSMGYCYYLIGVFPKERVCFDDPRAQFQIILSPGRPAEARRI